MYIDTLLSEADWLITEEDYHPEKNQFYETLFTLANGYVGARGSLEQGSQTGSPGTYFAGVYDPTPVFFTELANAPNWLNVKIVANNESIELEKGRILEYKRTLDMKKGLLTQIFRWEGAKGQITRFEDYRLVHLNYKHVALLKGVIVPENYDGPFVVKSGLNGYVFNTGVIEQLLIKHFKLTEYEDREAEGIYLEMKSRLSGISVGEASKLKLSVPSERSVEIDVDKITEVLTFEAKKGQAYEFEKYVTFYTSRDVEDVKFHTLKELNTRVDQGSEVLLGEHVSAWEQKWLDADVKIHGDEVAQRSLRFNIFHLIQSANEDDDRVSIPAKALHGEGYRGHIFWDTEIFMLPFFIYTNPRAARSLLMYRYHNLDAARENARIQGYKGAQFPWESADTGLETTPKELGNPLTGETVRIWTGEEEHHIVADVAYAVDHYYVATGDEQFLLKYGAEILLETARFWASRVQYDDRKKAYVIKKVIGPDEFHEHVDNNIYTNYMAKWNISKALEYIDRLKQKHTDSWDKLKKKIVLSSREIREWKTIANNLYLPYDEKTKLYEEFEGYFKLKEIDISGVDSTGLEKIVKDTKWIKQADVVMLHYLLGDYFDQETKKVNFHYYKRWTTHSSSLSPSIYAIMGIEVGNYRDVYQDFMRSTRIDLDDEQGNTSIGIHAASLGGAWQVAINGFAGMRIKNGMLSFKPWLPEKWGKLEFKVKWWGETLNVAITHETVELKLETTDPTRTVEVNIAQRVWRVKGGETCVISVCSQ